MSAVCLARGRLPEITSGKWVVVVPGHPRYKLDLLTCLKNKLPPAADLELAEVRYPLNPKQRRVPANA